MPSWVSKAATAKADIICISVTPRCFTVHSFLDVLGYSFLAVGQEVQSPKLKAMTGKVAGGAGMHARQGGMTLLEVLLAVVVVAAGLFATAAMQLQALQAADSARRDGQAAMALHSEHERRRR